MKDKPDKSDFPKVLIIGESIHKKTGTGITLFNFFADWPTDRLAILAGDSIWESDVKQCNNYFLWKTKYGIISRFLRRFFFKSRSYVFEGQVTIDDILKIQEKKENVIKTVIISPDINKHQRVFYKEFQNPNVVIKYIYRLFNDFLGLSPLNNQINLSESMDKWYRDYNPDVIYTFLNRYQQFQLILDLHKKYKTAYVVHPMDEHIKFMAPKGLLFLFWKYKMNSKFDILIRKANVRLSISDYMSEMYKSRYNLDFIAYHNPVDIDKWLPYAKINWKSDDLFRILYMGRYGFDNHTPIHALAQVVDELVIDGYNIQLDLRFTILSDIEGIKKFSKYKNTKIVVFNSQREYSEAYSEIPLILPSYDLLYIPYGFDKHSLEYFRLSIPTKTAEYMISGTPILVYAPKETAIFQYANNEKWGYLIGKESEADLKKAIIELFKNELLREQLGTQAKMLAIKNHDAKTVRNNLRLEFVKAAKMKI